MIKAFYRDTYAQVSLKTIENNIWMIRASLPAHVQMVATVKANGYGHGAYEVGQAALKAGVTFLSVALLDEAISLRKQGIQAPILILGPIRPADIAVAAEYGIHLTLPSIEWLEEAMKYTVSSPLHFHIKMDTGMHRIGLANIEELEKVIGLLQLKENFCFTGIFTHFATADEFSTRFYEEQLALFREYVGWLEKRNLRPEWVHCSNSGGTLRFEADMPFNLVRIGILMYGLEPSNEMRATIPKEIQPALSLYSYLTQVKQVKQGEHISYGYTYVAEGDEWIGTVPIGYADGWCRALQGFYVLIDGYTCEIVGRVCMDQMMVRLPHQLPIYTKVVLIGESNGSVIRATDVADYMHTISYEVLCLLSTRIPRVYDK